MIEMLGFIESFPYLIKLTLLYYGLFVCHLIVKCKIYKQTNYRHYLNCI
jgi:hypothetical protein